MSNKILSGPFVRVTLANFFNALNFACFLLLPLYIKELGGGAATVGAIMGTPGLAGLIVIPLIGLTLDRFGRRRFLLGGAATITFASAGFLAVDSIGPAMYALRAIQGICMTVSMTAAGTLAAELAPAAQRGRALGIFGTSTLMTHAIGPGLAEEIIRLGGFKALFGCTGAFSMVAVLLATGLPSGYRAAHGMPVAPWRVGRLQWVVAATMTCCGMGVGAVMTFTPTFVNGQGLGRISAFYTTYALAAVCTRVVGSGLSDSRGRRAVILPALLTLGSSILILASVRSMPVLILAGFLFGSALGVNFPALLAFVVDATAIEHLGRVQALVTGAFNLGMTSSAFFFGILVELIGYRPMFVTAALLPITAWVLFYFAGQSEFPAGAALRKALEGVSPDST